jgi:hypothetical protein
MEVEEKAARKAKASMADASATREYGTCRNTKYTRSHQKHKERRASARREPEQPRPYGTTSKKEATRNNGRQHTLGPGS